MHNLDVIANRILHKCRVIEEHQLGPWTWLPIVLASRLQRGIMKFLDFALAYSTSTLPSKTLLQLL